MVSFSVVQKLNHDEVEKEEQKACESSYKLLYFSACLICV